MNIPSVVTAPTTASCTRHQHSCVQWTATQLCTHHQHHWTRHRHSCGVCVASACWCITQSMGMPEHFIDVHNIYKLCMDHIAKPPLKSTRACSHHACVHMALWVMEGLSGSATYRYARPLHTHLCVVHSETAVALGHLCIILCVYACILHACTSPGVCVLGSF